MTTTSVPSLWSSDGDHDRFKCRADAKPTQPTPPIAPIASLCCLCRVRRMLLLRQAHARILARCISGIVLL